MIVVCNFVGKDDDVLDTTETGYSELVDNGALATLYKSATTFSLYSVHTRRASQYYKDVYKEVVLLLSSFFIFFLSSCCLGPCWVFNS